MKNGLKTKVMPCLASATMIVGGVMNAMPVMAVMVEKNTCKFDKYLVMDNEANVPNATFTFAVSAGVAADGVMAGVDANKVVVTGTSGNQVVFSTDDATKTDANSLIKDFDATTEKYVQKSVSLDFSACVFAEPGVYRYVVTESGTNQAVTNDASATRIVDVYVNNDGNGGTKIAGYVLYTDAESMDETKSQGFTNDYDTSNVTIRNEVTGNQASMSKYFAFTVEITDAVAGTIYDVDLSNASADADGNNNPTQLTVGEDGTVSQVFYLKHGEEIVVNGIAKNSKYSVTENADGYKATAAGVDGYTGAVSGTIESADVKTSYLNEKTGTIPTGVIMNVAPFASVTLLGGVGAGIVLAMRKKDTDAE